MIGLKLSVFDVDYSLEDGRVCIKLYCKDENGRVVIALDRNFCPYFYAKPKKGRLNKLKEKVDGLDLEKLEVKSLTCRPVMKILDGEEAELVKIEVNDPSKLNDVRVAIKDCKEVEETYEYDISTYKRYLIDKRIEPMGWVEVEGRKLGPNGECETVEVESIKPIEFDKEVPVDVIVFDTEWVEKGGKEELIMISMASNGFNTVLTTKDWKGREGNVEVMKDEGEMIKRFVDIIDERDPDFICGYNSDGFDFPKLKGKAKEFGAELNIGRDGQPIKVVGHGRIVSAKAKGRVHLDIFSFVHHILSSTLRSDVLSLDEVAQELLGIGKVRMDYKEMMDIWQSSEDIKRIVEYCLHDSFLTLKLAEHILPQVFSLCRLTGQSPSDCSRYSYSKLVETYYMRKAFDDNVVIPNRPKDEDMEGRMLAPVYKGATVIEPKKGIHSDILVFDFRSLYPTIIVTHNISPETFNCKCCKNGNVPGTDYCFCKNRKGFIPKNLEGLIKERQRIKKQMTGLPKGSGECRRLDNMQYALKIIANASYGYFGFFGARWYKRECGAAVAAWGRYYIQKVIDMAEKEGFEVVYGDTDSLMIKVPDKLVREKVKNVGEGFVKEVNKQMPGIIELEFRNVYRGGIFVARKGEAAGAKKRYALVDYDGNLEVRGFETVRRDWCELSKRLQKEILVTILKEKDPVKAVQTVRDAVKKIREGKARLEELTMFEQITRPISQYESIGPNVVAARKAIKRGRSVGVGSVIAFVITKGLGKISDRAEPVEDVKEGQYDPEYYVEHQILPAAMRVLEALGYNKQEVAGGKVQKKLGNWLK